jgi:hypothetical protein
MGNIECKLQRCHVLYSSCRLKNVHVKEQHLASLFRLFHYSSSRCIQILHPIFLTVDVGTVRPSVQFLRTTGGLVPLAFYNS